MCMEQGRTEAISPPSLPRPKSLVLGLGPNLAGGTVCALVTLSYALSYAEQREVPPAATCG